MRQWEIEDAREMARRVLETLGQKGKEELLRHFATVDQNFALGREVEETKRALQEVGVEIYEPSKLEIPKSSQGLFRSYSEQLKNYTEEELDRFLEEEIADENLRQKLIRLFWGEEGFLKRISVDLKEVLNRIQEHFQSLQDASKTTGRQDTEPLETGGIFNHTFLPFDLIEEGEEEILSLSEYEQTPFSWMITGSSVERENGMVFRKIATQQKEKDENEESLSKLQINQRDELKKFVESVFCFCVAQMGQLPENIVWWAEPKRAKPLIPDWIKEKIKLIKSIAQVYDFYDYSEHLLPAVRAFMKVTRS